MIPQICRNTNASFINPVFDINLQAQVKQLMADNHPLSAPFVYLRVNRSLRHGAANFVWDSDKLAHSPYIAALRQSHPPEQKSIGEALCLVVGLNEIVNHDQK